MNVSFTRKEFTRLIELAYMGEWMATSEADSDNDPYVKRYSALMQKLYKLAAENDDGCPEYVEPDEDDEDLLAPSHRLEVDSPAANALEKYSNENFWDELISRLSERDAGRETHRESATATLEPDEILEKQINREEQLEERYREEFVKHDLENLFVMFGTDRLS